MFSYILNVLQQNVQICMNILKYTHACMRTCTHFPLIVNSVLQPYFVSFDEYVVFRNRWQVVDYYLQRCTANIEILEKFNIIGRTSEFAKLYGILFSEVLSHGSQVIKAMKLGYAITFIV